MMQEQRRAEAVGSSYDREMMLQARARVRDALYAIAAKIVPGMLEESAVELARRHLKAAGLLRGWHALHVRCGRNTLLPFGAPSEPNVVLGNDDIFFLDIGPVWQRWEGDAGDTFVVGDDPGMHRIARDVRAVFEQVRIRWQQDGISGIELYRYASEAARSLGWELNLDMSGHRLADFPHAALHQGALAEAPFAPSAGLWVLEIQIRHPELPYSAFYEDLLL